MNKIIRYGIVFVIGIIMVLSGFGLYDALTYNEKSIKECMETCSYNGGKYANFTVDYCICERTNEKLVVER